MEEEAGAEEAAFLAEEAAFLAEEQEVAAAKEAEEAIDVAAAEKVAEKLEAAVISASSLGTLSTATSTTAAAATVDTPVEADGGESEGEAIFAKLLLVACGASVSRDDYFSAEEG